MPRRLRRGLLYFTRGEGEEALIVPGVIFAVFCGDAHTFKRNKHIDSRWISPKLQELKDKPRVPDFDKTIRTANKRVRELWNVPAKVVPKGVL